MKVSLRGRKEKENCAPSKTNGWSLRKKRELGRIVLVPRNENYSYYGKEESKEQYCVNGSRNNRSSSSYVCVREPIQNDEMFTHIHPNILLSHVTPHLQHNPYIFYPPLPCLTPISIGIHFQSPSPNCDHHCNCHNFPCKVGESQNQTQWTDV